MIFEWRYALRQSFARSTYAPSAVITTTRVPALMCGGGVADRILSAGRAHANATRALAHWEVADVVRKVCCMGETVKSVAEQTGEGCDVVVKLLKAGLGLLAVHYGMMLGRRVG